MPLALVEENMSRGRADEVETLLLQEWKRVLGRQPKVCYGEYLAVMVQAAEVVYKEPPRFLEKTTSLLDAWLHIYIYIYIYIFFLCIYIYIHYIYIYIYIL